MGGKLKSELIYVYISDSICSTAKVKHSKPTTLQ